MKMAIFPTVILSCYGLTHIYLWRRLQVVLALGVKTATATALLMLTLMLSPILGSFMLKQGWVESGWVLGNVGFYWLGLYFIIFCLEMLILILAFIQARIGKLAKSAGWRNQRATLYTTIATAVLINIYGYFEAGQVEINRLEMSNPAMAQGADPVTLVQISDVHYGLNMTRKRHTKLVNMVKELQPDIIVATGDFIDRGAERLAAYMDDWQALKPRLGKFAVSGNHEAIVGMESSALLYRRCGFRMLEGEYVDLAAIRLIGIDDPRTGYGGKVAFDPDELPEFEGATILLYHRPIWPEALSGHFDLALSGHTHGGQMFPFGYLVKLVHGEISGLHPTPWGGWRYLNLGAGTWGPPVRILAPPEIMLLSMVHGVEKSVTFKGAGQ